MAFPQDDYTPYGYLDLPAHTRNLNPQGVMRSFDAGFRWHFPAYMGLYGGQREIYSAGLRLGLDGALALADFDRASSPYHSKDLVRFDLWRGAARAQAEFSMVGEDALYVTITASAAGRLSVHLDYRRLLGARHQWGESGLVGRLDGRLLVLQGFEDGEAFALWSSRRPRDYGLTAEEEQARSWAVQPAPGLPDLGYLSLPGARGERVALYGVVGFELLDDQPLELLLVRGRTLLEARRRLEPALERAADVRDSQRAADATFWQAAPRLEGDWPAHWRRGLVYDFETVRMMLKQPAGIYRHVWDAMQIQAPRVVLAEAAIDALLLSYADPALAQELMLGTFLDAPEPQVPCSREDGSYNMVAIDGTVCGTAPSWGYPWLVIEHLMALRPSLPWLGQLYPALAAYLDWWLEHRRDPEGWLVYSCSWESGQDCSPRFGPLPLGCGQPSPQLRPVDLQAAFAHAAGSMARFAALLGRAGDEPRWAALAEEFKQRTAQLWNGARFADFDSAAGASTAVDDVMLLAPLALQLVEPRRAEQLRPAVEALDPDELTWPMFIWTAVDAALSAGLPLRAAELAAAICERAYGFWDERELRPGRTLPGVSCEYWPPDGRCAGEGYGWGAFMIHLVLHVLVGLRPTSAGLSLRPNLPAAWRVPGRSYGLRMAYRGAPLSCLIEPLEGERVAVSVNGQRYELGWAEVVAYKGPSANG